MSPLCTMKTILSLFILYSLSLAAIAQQNELNSLLRVFPQHSQADTVRFNLLNSIAYDYAEIDPEKGIQFANQAIALAANLSNASLTAAATSTKGLNYIRLGEDSMAEKMYNTALTIYADLKNERGYALQLYRLAEIYFNRAQYFKALESLDQAKIIFAQKEPSFLLNIYNSTGAIYSSLSNNNRALEFYLKALAIAERSSDPQTIATILGNTGTLYGDIKQYDKALAAHRKALHLYELAGNNLGKAMEYEGIGIVYDNQNNKPGALQYYTKALTLNESINNKRGVANNLSNMGIVYFDQHKYVEAMDNFFKAKKIYEEVDDKYSLATVLNMIGDTYTGATPTELRSYAVTNRFEIANAYNGEALDLAKEAGSLTKQEEILQSMATVYEKQNDFAQVAAVYKKLLPLHDSILNNASKEEITRQELNYDFEKKETLAAAEIRRQQTVKNAAIAGGSVLLLSAITSFLFYKRRRDAEEQKTKAELKSQVSDVEMKALRSQMNPHFIFNSLHSINNFVLGNDSQSASSYLARFSKLMRLILENSREQEVTLDKDLAALDLYLQLESLRFENRFSYTIYVDKSIETDNTLIPPLLLQPFVENAIIHGLANKAGGNIQVAIKKINGQLLCTVEDNGKGRASISVEQRGEKKQASLGMKITQERLTILNRIKQVQSAINIFDLKDSGDQPKGLRIELLLPFEQAF